jgi:hypothetical protein
MSVGCDPRSLHEGVHFARCQSQINIVKNRIPPNDFGFPSSRAGCGHVGLFRYFWIGDSEFLNGRIIQVSHGCAGINPLFGVCPRR